MASSVISLSSRALSLFPETKPLAATPLYNATLHFRALPIMHRLQASRPASDFAQQANDFVDDPRNWSLRGTAAIEDFDDADDDDDEDDDEEDRSLDLLVRFVQNVFKKISRRARKAIRSILPLSISTKLVGFSVNGTIVLAFLWVLKAFLEVVCTLGSVVFVSILLIRGIWSGITYLQDSRYHKMNEFNEDRRSWTGAQPAT